MSTESSAGWKLVSNSDFEEFLRLYPRPLTVDPPLGKKARFRRFLDPSLGSWPESQVASVHVAHKSTVNVVRSDMIASTPRPASQRPPP